MLLTRLRCRMKAMVLCPTQMARITLDHGRLLWYVWPCCPFTHSFNQAIIFYSVKGME